jgi:hypothetical protein
MRYSAGLISTTFVAAADPDWPAKVGRAQLGELGQADFGAIDAGADQSE